MATENKSVLDGKLTDEQLGKLQRKLGEIKRRIDEGTNLYQDAIDVMQGIIIENKSVLHLGVLRGTHEIKAIEHVIDCGGNPFIPNDWKMEKHQGSGVVRLEKRADGQLYINGKKVILYLSKKQLNGESIVGNELREEISGKEILNAIVLDYLLAHPGLIPDDWKKDEKGNIRYIFFWGTIYRISDGYLYVRCLRFDGGEWDWYYYWLDYYFDGRSPSAVLAS